MKIPHLKNIINISLLGFIGLIVGHLVFSGPVQAYSKKGEGVNLKTMIDNLASHPEIEGAEAKVTFSKKESKYDMEKRKNDLPVKRKFPLILVLNQGKTCFVLEKIVMGVSQNLGFFRCF